MQKFLESLKGYRTIIVNATVALVGVLVALGVIPASEAAGWSPATIGGQFDLILGAFASIFGVVNILLRLVTNTKPGKQDAPVKPAA